MEYLPPLSFPGYDILDIPFGALKQENGETQEIHEKAYRRSK